LAKLLKITGYLLIILFLFLFLSAVTGLIVINKYGNEIKSYVIHRLNKELAVRVEIREADISFFRTFPFISMVLEDIVAFSNKELNPIDFPEINTDTLFRADKIYIQFNIIDIIQGQYIIKRILANNGELNLFTDSSGFINYKLFKKASSGKDNEQTLELEFFKLKNFKVLMNNKIKNLYTSGNVQDILFKGKFGKKEFSLITGGTVYLETFIREDILYAENSDITLKVIFTADDSVYAIDRGVLVYNDLQFETAGFIISGNNIFSDLQVTGKNLNIKSLIKALPSYLTKWSNEYSPDGRTDINLSVKGNITGTDAPLINADFKIRQGSLKYPGWETHPKNISLSGKYTNGKLRNATSSIFEFNNIHANSNESSVSGSLTINNLISPQISSSLKGIIQVNDINNFIDSNIFSFKSGILKPELNVYLSLNSFKDFDFKTILAENVSGSIDMENLSFRINEEYPEITGLNGNVRITNDSWMSMFNFLSGKSNIQFKGQIDHIIKRFVRKTSSLWIQGDASADYLDLSFLINNQQQNDNEKSFILPDKLYIKLHLFVDDFVLNKFTASGIISDLTYKPRFLTITSLDLKTMKGSLNSYGGLIQDMQGNLLLRTSSRLTKIDIREMFETFNNFKQNFIVSENLEGYISGSVDFSVNINSLLEPEMESIYAVSDVTIENGELKDFSPLKSLSKFIELSELEHVKFKTLKNNIIIREQKVFVPEMSINSSAFNIIASGLHGFDNNFEYKVRVNLSEILAKKARKKKENDEFAVLEKDGQRVTIFLTIFGNPDDFKIRYDRKEAVNQIKEDIKTEKQELKTILYEEFGLFKKQLSDSVKREEGKDPGPQFIFEWDEQKDSVETPDNKRGKKEFHKKEKEFKFIFE